MTLVPAIVAVVVVVAVSAQRSVVVVKLFAQHDHPLGAVAVLPIVTTTVQVPVVPEANCPDVAPPTVVPFEQPVAVYFVPSDM